jgi:hypothetical protein
LIAILCIISKDDTIDGKNKLLIISTKKDESKKVIPIKRSQTKREFIL